MEANLDKQSVDDFARVLAQFALDVSVDTLAPAAINAAKMNLLDTLTCVAAGSSAAGVAEVHQLVKNWGGSPQASVLVFGEKIPAHHAAWVNGTMSHARDYDDTHDAAVLHAGVSVVPAALAAAQLSKDATGADLISGIAAGLETICRLGVATKISIIDSGYMYTPLFGYFAATIAAARVMRLDLPTTVNALGIVYSQASGNHQVTRDAALTKRMQPGFAAMSAILSVQLAQTGIRGVQSTFEGEDGFFRVYLHNHIDRQMLRQDLGKKFEFTQLSYKPYPCCRFNHSGIDAAVQIKATHSIRIEDIKAIRVGLNRQAYQAVCTPIEIRKSPKTVVQAQFSTPYTLACALVDGKVQLSHFTEKSFQRADLQNISNKVEPYIDPEIERTAGRNVTPAALEIEMIDGRTIRHRVDIPAGHPDCPMTDAEKILKAQDCFNAAALPLPEHAIQNLLTLVGDIENQKTVETLIEAMISKRV